MTRRLIFLLAISLVPSVSNGAGIGDKKVELTVVPAAKAGRQMLQFSITNSSDAPLEIPWPRLPWGGGEGLLLAAAQWGVGQDWWGLEPAADTEAREAGDKATIAPGATVRGELVLDEHVQNLGTALRAQDVVVFWFWSPDTGDQGGFGSHGGFIVIPKGGLKGDRVGVEQGSPAATPEVDVEVSPARGALRFSIASHAKTPLEIPREYLPWVFPPNTVIAAAGTRPPRVLRSFHPPIGLPYGEVLLHPGEALTGYLELDRRLENIHGEIDRSEVVVFWLYAGKTTDGRSLGRHGGFVVFPKGGLADGRAAKP